jgi:hypothetical protein
MLAIARAMAAIRVFIDHDPARCSGTPESFTPAEAMRPGRAAAGART